MFSIAQRHEDWTVLENDEVVSVHPTREERVVVWLMTHTHGRSVRQVHGAFARELVPDRPGR